MTARIVPWQEAARRLGCGRRKVFELLSKGRLRRPEIRFGKVTMVTAESLEALESEAVGKRRPVGVRGRRRQVQPAPVDRASVAPSPDAARCAACGDTGRRTASLPAAAFGRWKEVDVRCEECPAGESTNLPTLSRAYLQSARARLQRMRLDGTAEEIFKRDGYRCRYCGEGGRMTLDHVVPMNRGGSDFPSNIVSACSRCNRAKSDRTPEEAGMPLRLLDGEAA